MSPILDKSLIQFLVLLLISVQAACQHVDKQERFPDLDQEIEALLEEFHAAGLAVGVVEKGGLSFVKGYGYRNVEQAQAVDENTLFGLGSVSKAFTAGVLGILGDAGKLTMEDRPQQHIPDLRFFNKQMDADIKIKHLLSHSSGMEVMTSESSCILFLSEDRNAMIPRMKYLAPAAGVGEDFRYNNLMYTLAGIIGERITGKPWEENVRALLLQPLRMDDTRVGYVAASQSPNFAYGYSVLATNPQRVPPETIMTRAPAGDIYSSISDMSKWLTVWLNGGQQGKQQILSKQYLSKATGPQQYMTTEAVPSPGTPSYGYGWMISDFHGYKRVEHSGAISGYSANVVLFPNEGIGTVVLSNQSNSSLPNVVTRLLIDRLLKLDRAPDDQRTIRYSQIHPLEPADIKTELSAEDAPSYKLEALAAKYTHPGFGTIEVSYQQGTLLATLPFTTFRLVHESGNTFSSTFTEEVPQLMGPWVTFTFQGTTSAGADSVLVNLGEEPVPFNRE